MAGPDDRGERLVAGLGEQLGQDRASVLEAMNQAVSRLYAYESREPGPGGDEDAAA